MDEKVRQQAALMIGQQAIDVVELRLMLEERDAEIARLRERVARWDEAVADAPLTDDILRP